ncbi:hypothetical protein MNBD_GAMMA16-519 [hydrothermal vent metagenome]|uniref:Methyltransferase type 11 domain-containing protein n=1 Tax=hydrothermal vent metagenome TaxID=652676 RepID=A0A3B0YYU7_9ZZZZ
MTESHFVNSETRFQFGQNWLDYSVLIDDEKIAQAERRLIKLLGSGALENKTFLDIGCGSGLHSLAALRLGAKQVLAIDLDPKSVATTQAVLNKFWRQNNFTVEQCSVFDLHTTGKGKFDIVYSWGVLHHTGNMVKAIEQASDRVKANGLLALALYGKTRHCERWTKIKYWYINATSEQQAKAERWYVRLFGFYILLRGKRLATHIANYNQKRGMDFYYDVRDWIGGYPYESISPDQLRQILTPRSFSIKKENVRRRSGLFGSGNDEYLFIKVGT